MAGIKNLRNAQKRIEDAFSYFSENVSIDDLLEVARGCPFLSLGENRYQTDFSVFGLPYYISINGQRLELRRTSQESEIFAVYSDKKVKKFCDSLRKTLPGILRSSK